MSGVISADFVLADGLLQSYYEYLAPLTPISPPDFRQLDTISNLLSEEPLLAVTILYLIPLSRHPPLTEDLAEPSHHVSNDCRGLEVSHDHS